MIEKCDGNPGGSICLVAVEWHKEADNLRRLVEEAQAKRDRLKVDYDAEKAEHVACAAELRSTHADVDRLKGELAEARRLLRDARGHLVAATGIIADETDADEEDIRDEFEFIGTVDTYLAAPPAEQEQGEGATHDDDCPCDDCDPPDCGTGGVHHPYCRDAGKAVATKPSMETQIAALAKRVDTLTFAVGHMVGGQYWLNMAAAPPPTEAVRHAVHLGKGSVCTDEACMWRGHHHAGVRQVPPPETAGPGRHVFAASEVNSDFCDAKPEGFRCGRSRGNPIHLDCALISCERPGCRGEQDHITGCADNPDHDVPPITGGAK